MRKYQVMTMVVLLIGVCGWLSAQNWRAKSTELFSISVPSEWTVNEVPEELEELGESVAFSASYVDETSLMPTTISVFNEKIEAGDMEKSLETLTEERMEDMNAELIEAGLGDMIDIVESGEIRHNGKDGYRMVMNVSMFGMSIYSELMLFKSGEDMLTFVIMGIEDKIEELEPTLAAIKKSFIIK